MRMRMNGMDEVEARAFMYFGTGTSGQGVLLRLPR